MFYSLEVGRRDSFQVKGYMCSAAPPAREVKNSIKINRSLLRGGCMCVWVGGGVTVYLKSKITYNEVNIALERIPDHATSWKIPRWGE